MNFMIKYKIYFIYAITCIYEINSLLKMIDLLKIKANLLFNNYKKKEIRLNKSTKDIEFHLQTTFFSSIIINI